MGQLVFQANAGGQTALVGPNPSTSISINIPATNGNMVTTGDSGTVTNTMLASSAYTAPGTIGSGTPNTGAFTTLGATGVATFSAGTVSAPAITTTGDTNTGIFFPAADTIAFAEGGAESMRIDSSGNVGIGVTPSAWSTANSIKSLQIPSGALWNFSTNYLYLGQNYYWNGSNRIYINTDGASEYQQNAGTHIWYTAPSGTAGTTATLSERMRIGSDGNFFVGTTAAGNTNSNSMSFYEPDGSIYVNHITGAASGKIFVGFGYAGNDIGSITQSGTTAVLYNLTSDARLKTNIVDAPLGNIDNIKVRSFDWKSDGSHVEYGFIAQELVEVAPYAVHQPQDPDEMMAVDYSKLVPMMIKEIQDLKQRIKTLENK